MLSACLAFAGPLDAGTKSVKLHARDGTSVEIRQVVFTPRADGRVNFVWKADTSRFTDHFLSMREFKCLPGQGEIMCLVPYPYPQPGHIAANDLAWLEHSLLFMFKKQSELGAQLWNGVIFKLAATPTGLVGAPQAVDLNRIAAPPARTDVLPYGAAQCDSTPRPTTRNGLRRCPRGRASRAGSATRFVHRFATERSRLATALKGQRERLPSDAVLWVSWPKKSVKVATDITEDTIRELALPLGWVDVKVCAVSAVWSGLKLVVRKTLR